MLPDAALTATLSYTLRPLQVLSQLEVQRRVYDKFLILHDLEEDPNACRVLLSLDRMSAPCLKETLLMIAAQSYANRMTETEYKYIDL